MSDYARDLDTVLKYMSDGEAINRGSVYGEHGHRELVPHLAFCDWLIDQGHPVLSGLLRKAIEEGHGIRSGVNIPNATTRGIGKFHHMFMSASKPVQNHVNVNLTPNATYEANAADEGSPYHYSLLLNAHEAHDLADELKRPEANTENAEPDFLGRTMKSVLRQLHMKDTRPRPAPSAE